VEWDGKIPDCPKYGLWSFFLMEIKTRVLARLGLWHRGEGNGM
jgi:hypothetical protein